MAVLGDREFGSAPALQGARYVQIKSHSNNLLFDYRSAKLPEV